MLLGTGAGSTCKQINSFCEHIALACGGFKYSGSACSINVNMADHSSNFLRKIVYDIIRWSGIRQCKQGGRENELKTMEIISWQ